MPDARIFDDAAGCLVLLLIGIGCLFFAVWLMGIIR
jgi:Na+/phosphate symporter